MASATALCTKIMSNFFETMSQSQDAWFSETIGEPNGNPVMIRVMNDVIAPFHTHETADEMFIVLSGTVFIDTASNTQTINAGQSHTVAAGIEHRARVEGRAELIVIGG